MYRGYATQTIIPYLQFLRIALRLGRALLRRDARRLFAQRDDRAAPRERRGLPRVAWISFMRSSSPSKLKISFVIAFVISSRCSIK